MQQFLVADGNAAKWGGGFFYWARVTYDLNKSWVLEDFFGVIYLIDTSGGCCVSWVRKSKRICEMEEIISLAKWACPNCTVFLSFMLLVCKMGSYFPIVLRAERQTEFSHGVLFCSNISARLVWIVSFLGKPFSISQVGLDLLFLPFI